ncbi:hypothetical protein RFI_08127, partial [Reticulomyxa filosa]
MPELKLSPHRQIEELSQLDTSPLRHTEPVHKNAHTTTIANANINTNVNANVNTITNTIANTNVNASASANIKSADNKITPKMQTNAAVDTHGYKPMHQWERVNNARNLAQANARNKEWYKSMPNSSFQPASSLTTKNGINVAKESFHRGQMQTNETVESKRDEPTHVQEDEYNGSESPTLLAQIFSSPAFVDISLHDAPTTAGQTNPTFEAVPISAPNETNLNTACAQIQASINDDNQIANRNAENVVVDPIDANVVGTPEFLAPKMSNRRRRVLLSTPNSKADPISNVVENKRKERTVKSTKRGELLFFFFFFWKEEGGGEGGEKKNYITFLCAIFIICFAIIIGYLGNMNLSVFSVTITQRHCRNE